MPSLPPGSRAYAIGDIHGRFDLLDELLELIDRDDAARGRTDTTLIVLGDFVDRGPASAAVVERLRRLKEESASVRVLMGNHEEVFLGAIEGEPKALRLFCRIGGRETALSYGLEGERYERMDYDTFATWLADHVPAGDRAFLAGLEDIVELGDYVFVHAGVRPGVALEEQRTSDLRWIRDPFLEHRRKLDRMIVHGHTAEEEVQFRPHRIGIDTGAYSTGRLTALGLEATERWLIQAGGGRSAA